MQESDRYLVVDGRRWRRTDPSVPEALRAELVRSLMAGRRAVKTAKEDHDATSSARRQVHDAKLALGERGEPWWDEPTENGRVDRIAAIAMTLLRGRDDDATICPSDVARTVGGDEWRSQMDLVRSTVGELVEAGTLAIRQGGEDVDVDAAGPIRIGRGRAFDEGRRR